MKPSFRLSQKLRGLIWLKFASRTYSLNIAAPQLIANISAVAQPQLRGTPQASRWASAGGSGSSLPVAGSAGHGVLGPADGKSTNGRQERPRRPPHSTPESTSGRPMGDMSYDPVL